MSESLLRLLAECVETGEIEPEEADKIELVMREADRLINFFESLEVQNG